MNLSNLQVTVKDNQPLDQALKKCTHMAVGAHPDDVELTGLHGILQCFDSNQSHFLGVVVTAGGGSVREGSYANVTSEELAEIRYQEQLAAALVGRYEVMVQVQLSSEQVKSGHQHLVDVLRVLLDQANVHTLYSHNPFDRHATHLGVLKHLIEAIALSSKHELLQHIYGVEVWRSLDWLPRAYRSHLDVAARPHLASALMGLFDSQIASGKRYDRAFIGRLEANATFYESHAEDCCLAQQIAVDLIEPLRAKQPIDDFIQTVVADFQQEMTSLWQSPNE